MRPKLLLFDIDGTLLDTGGAGGSALLDSAEKILKVKREALPPLDLAGATDLGVIRTLFADAQVAQQPDTVAAFCEAYFGFLEARLSGPKFQGRLLPGVTKALEILAQDDRFVLGLLTGNFRRGAEIKLDRFGLRASFLEGAFGDDAEDRNLLGPIAVARLSAACGHQFLPQEVIVIGDTPKDVACAEALGARCVAVATGKFSLAALQAYESWQVLEDLSDTEQFIDLLAA